MFGYSHSLLNHHIGKQLDRENIKNIIEIENDITKAELRINELIIISDNYKNNNAQNDNQADIDNKSLHHAKEHLDAYVNTNQEHQKTKTIRALNEGIIEPIPDPL